MKGEGWTEKRECPGRRISISCRSALDKRNKVKGQRCLRWRHKSPRGSHRAADAIGNRRAFTSKSATNTVHTNVTTLERRMGSVNVYISTASQCRHMANNLLKFNELHSHRPAIGFAKSSINFIMSWPCYLPSVKKVNKTKWRPIRRQSLLLWHSHDATFPNLQRYVCAPLFGYVFFFLVPFLVSSTDA